MQQFFKGLFIMLVTLAVTLFAQTPIVWGIVVITVIGNVLVYAGKNAFEFLKSDSPANILSLINYISVLIILIGTGFLDALATLLINGTIQWLLVGKLALSVTLTYLGSTLFSGPNTKLQVN